MKNFIPRPGACRGFCFVARLNKRSRTLAICSYPRPAHLFSMRTNGLSLKPCDRLPPGRLTHSGHVAPRIFFATLPGGGKTSFPPFFCARWTCAKSDGYPLHRIMRVCIFGRDSVTNSLNGACGFIKRRLRTVSPMLKSSPV